MKNKKILAVIRTSSIRQEIQSQKTDIIKFCTQKGFREEDIIFIEGQGASARKRNEKYLQMLEDIQTTIERYNIKYVAVWHLNRLGRTEENLSYLKEYFERNHIQVYIKNPSLTLFNEDGTLNNGTSMAWTIFAMMIKFETIELMEKLHRGRQYRKEQKKFNGGMCLFGYQVNENGYFEENTNESQIVNYIFNSYSKGKLSSYKLALELNEKGFRSRTDKSFTGEYVSKILRTEDYFNGDSYPPIISKELYEKCKAVSSNNNCEHSKERTIHLGSKLLRCPQCGHLYTFHKSNGLTYYFDNGVRFGTCTTDAKSIRSIVFDYCLKQTTLNIYSKVLLEKGKEDITVYEQSIEEKKKRITTLEETISRTEKKIKRINDLYINGSYLNEEDYKKDFNHEMTIRTNSITRKSELENEIKSLNKRISVIKNGKSEDIRKYMDIRKNILQITDLKQLKEMINQSVSSSYLKKVSLNGKSYTAIILISALDINIKYLYLYRNEILYHCFNLSNEITTTQEDYLNNRKPKLLPYFISMEEYQQIIG